MELRSLEDAARYLEGFINRERDLDFSYERLGLRPVRALLEAVNDPQEDFPCVHIAGSKGKGSVALCTESLLRAAGLATGTYTSPHLESWRERFLLSGRPVEADLLLDTLRILQPAADRLRAGAELRPSFFDVSTALAFLLFSRTGVEAGVIEVGLGGRLDSTNVVRSQVIVITSIQLEHTDKLGSTRAEISFEKAGILRGCVPVLHGALAPEAFGVLMARAVAENAPLEEVRAARIELAPGGLRFQLEDGREIRSPVLGRHQADNLALGIRAAEIFLGRPLLATELRELETLALPGRIERVGDVILDCAHTPDSARALRQTLEEIWPERSWRLVVSISSDKNAAEILRELAPLTTSAWITRAEPSRSADPAELVLLARACGIEKAEVCVDPRTAFARARSERRDPELVVLTGSVYLAGQIRPGLR